MIDLLLSETNRSKYYLKYILNNRIKINQIVYYSKKKKDLYKLIQEKKLLNKTLHVKSNSINTNIIDNIFSNKKKKYKIIYSGYSGEMVKSNILLKNNLYHFHSGDLPLFKGSTTIFYTVAMKKKIIVTCIKLNKGIDEGEILYKKKFNIPKNKNSLNSYFDDKIRAETMIDFLKKGKKNYKKKIKTKHINTYYVAHPLIRGFALHKEKLNKLYLKI